jgi:hypothetical protein
VKNPATLIYRLLRSLRKEQKRRSLNLKLVREKILFFAKNGFEAYSLGYSKNGILVMEPKVRENGLSGHVTTLQHDMRKPLPLRLTLGILQYNVILLK